MDLKFKIGDSVIVIKPDNNFYNKRGKISNVDRNDDRLPYCVSVNGCIEWLRENDIVPDEGNITVEIIKPEIKIYNNNNHELKYVVIHKTSQKIIMRTSDMQVAEYVIKSKPKEYILGEVR